MEKFLDWITYKAICIFTKSTPDISVLTDESVSGVAGGVDASVSICEDDAAIHSDDDATLARLFELLCDPDFVAALDNDAYDRYVSLWGSLHSQANCTRFLANHGV